MTYLEWNDLIAARVFRPAMAGKRVYLFITPELIAELGAPRKSDLQDFLSAVRTGPSGIFGENICEKAERVAINWRKRRLTYPPYIGYLSFFVLAAGIDGEFAPHAYYPRLRKLLGETNDNRSSYPSFPKMRLLWEDLERWSQKDKESKYGQFHIRLLGGYPHVGIPISQSFLGEADIHRLHYFFAEMDLEPTAPPSQQVLAQLMVRHGGAFFSNRVLKILNFPVSNREEYKALIEIAEQELKGWDGSYVDGGARKQHAALFMGSLRLCWAALDRVAGVATVRIRATAQRALPEDGLDLREKQGQTNFHCEPYVGSWSSILCDQDTGKPFDAGKLDWEDDLSFRDGTRRWRFSLKPASIRVFVSGAAEGIPGMIEVQRLAASGSSIVAVEGRLEGRIVQWGQSSCAVFKRLQVHSGVPRNWIFYSVESPIHNDKFATEYPVLSVDSAPVLALEGGIRFNGNYFFAFALPTVLLVSRADTTHVFCNGKQLNGNNGRYELDPLQAIETKLEIEARAGKRVLASCSVYVVEDFVNSPSDYYVDRFGGLGTSSSPRDYVRGAHVVCQIPPWPPSEIEQPEARVPVSRTATNWGSAIKEWKTNLTSNDHHEKGTAIRTLQGGRELTEGALQYQSAVQHSAPRNFNRSIAVLTTAQNKGSAVVQGIARGLLQLALFRSGRPQQAARLSCELPREFERLSICMQALAAHCLGKAQTFKEPTAGIGFAEISPLNEDQQLEQLLFSDPDLDRKNK